MKFLSKLTTALLMVSMAPVSFAGDFIPDIKRRDIVTPAIDTENFELAAFRNLFSVQDFTMEPKVSLHLAYHINEDFFVEASLGQTDVGLSAAEEGTPDFSDRGYVDYHLSLGWNFLPGEAYYSDTKTYTTSAYLIGGIGSTDFAGDTSSTLHFGGGYRVLITDNLAIRFEAKDFITSIEDGTIANRSRQHNLSIGVGASLFF